ncbi:Trm112 family protein [Nocardioides lentus]|uniref:UPF0434 protein GCM10009737_29000 n=1 Tax=Nocardioides lentus TaxID=338077 RepID=A0ABP5AY10_9ACTN
MSAGAGGIDPRLLEVVACPDCRSTLEVEVTDAVTTLRCTGCGLVYPVRDSIPVLLVDEATPGPRQG